MALVAIGVAAAYLLLANVFLSTGWFARVVNADPETLDVHFAKGWTLWPGRLHARDLSIRATDGNVEWILRIDDVTFDVSLWGLLHRRFFADHVRGTGVSLRLRQRLDALPKSEAQVADLPPIEGLPPYGVRSHVEDPYPVWDDAFWDLWTIRLRDVVAEHTREVWIDALHFVGDARVAGGFYLKPIREAQIGPVRAEIAEGRLLRGGGENEKEPLAATLGGSLDVTVDAFDPRVTFGRALLARVSTEVSASAELRRPVRAFVTARTGTIRGRIEDGSRVEAFVPEVQVPLGDMRATGSVLARAEARGGEIDVLAQSWRANLDRGGRFVAEADLRLDARASGLDLVRGGDLEVSGSRLAISRATIAGHARVEDRWGGEITLQHAHLRPAPFGFYGLASLGASDTLPLFTTLLRDRAPRIAESLLAMPRLQGLAWVTVAPGTFAVRDLVARGGDVWIRGAYGRAGQRGLGAFVIDKGPLSAGFGIDDAGVHPRVFGLDAWLDEQETELNRLMGEEARLPAARERGARGPRSSP